MNKIYVSPAIRTTLICGTGHLLADSMKVDRDNKVSDSNDIGFVKGQSSGNYNVWNDDWAE